ncbi:hypothetical protein Q9S36_39575 [Microbacterium sp. ARD31]|uniref:hypothetical protein n=1 Tax=Microbacterium sp. ARD31 TaxID=2962576 RepID=UPI002881A856|nr:hypothetical protein [Microbacterium sp. ARD31]MDT0186306.1 hypothetical protein [Microbacterium sp. ARD31]
MSELRAPLPSVLAQGILDRLTRMGREVADAEAQTIRDAKVTAREAERDADRLAKLIEVDGADTDLPMSPDAEPACRAQAVFPDAGSPPLGVMSTIRSTTPSAGRPSTRTWRTCADDITFSCTTRRGP